MLDSDRAGGLARPMWIRLVFLLCLTCLGGCAGLPGVSDTLTPRPAYPLLVPLGPLLAQGDAMTPRSAEIEGQNLAARAADLRRRAALLREMTI
jgi:hypothetical protein